MIGRIVLSVIVAVVVGLLCLLGGSILVAMGASVPVLITIGDFLQHFGWVLGLLAGLWYFFARSASHPGSIL